jgi:beta-N-acetylhexosaminidase
MRGSPRGGSVTAPARDSASAVLVAAVESLSLSEAERLFLEEERPAGVTLFRRNISERFADVAALSRSIQATRRAGEPPLIIAIDQEGGRVARLRAPFPDLGPASGLAGGAADEKALAFLESYGQIVGLSLRGLGINVDFAPVLDVRMEYTDDAIGDRAFGDSPESVEQRAGSFLAGLSASGVLGCLKHFPGQGGARADTHHETALIDRSLEELHEWELRPFRTLLASTPMVMISHCTYPALEACPASRSSAVIEKLLRSELGFGGVVVSDDMNMGAVARDDVEWQEAIVGAVRAGVDMVLVCRHVERARMALGALRRTAERDPEFERRLARAARRVTELRAGLCG